MLQLCNCNFRDFGADPLWSHSLAREAAYFLSQEALIQPMDTFAMFSPYTRTRTHSRRGGDSLQTSTNRRRLSSEAKCSEGPPRFAFDPRASSERWASMEDVFHQD
jgi:hypothetical protein